MPRGGFGMDADRGRTQRGDTLPVALVVETY
jgi:hypothetical protein